MINECGLLTSDEGYVDDSIKSLANLISDLIDKYYNSLTLIILDYKRIFWKMIA